MIQIIQLRPYQTELINSIKSELRKGKRSVCAVLGCGGGKSVIQGIIAKGATDKHNRVLFLVHRQELCSQITNTFTACGVNFDYCSVSMVQTVSRRLAKAPKPALIITDEAHHALSDTYKRIYNYFPEALRLGFTATPCRMNEGGLGEVFDSLVTSVSTTWLIENNFLSPYRYYSVKLANTDGVHTRQGDYDKNEIAELMEKSVIYGETVSNYLKIADGTKTIVYCASIEASKKTAEQFQSVGITAAHLDGNTPKTEREQTMQDFRNDKIQVLCNVDLFGEGLDVPDCECVILLRPTKSLTLYIQQSMRSMRYKRGKTAIIIDHVGNVFRHGFPDDEREWSLSSKKRKEKNTVLVKECPNCFHVMRNTCTECPECGYVFKKEERSEIQTKQAELQELQKTDLLKLQPANYYKQIKTFDEMKLFCKAKGYKFAWCIHKCIELGISVPQKYQYMMKFLNIREVRL